MKTGRAAPESPPSPRRVLEGGFAPLGSNARLALALEAGRVRETGSHDELVASDGIDARLFDHVSGERTAKAS